MGGSEAQLLEIATRISDGEAVDWDAAAQSLSGEDDRRALAGEMERALAEATVTDRSSTDRPQQPPGQITRHWGLVAVLALIGVAAAIFMLKSVMGSGSYRVQASVVRHEGARTTPLESGDTVTVGDRISLEIRTSRDTWTYVFNRDTDGKEWALFPLPGLVLQNPLPSGAVHRLPGATADEPISWLIDSDGGREQFVFMTSPRRLVEFERAMSQATRPERSADGLALSDEAGRVLRGMGGLAPIGQAGPGSESTGLFDMARVLTAEEEEVRGAWLRRIELIHAPPEVGDPPPAAKGPRTP